MPDYFDGRELVRTLPPACIAECSASGDCTKAVQHWLTTLGFDAPQDYTRDYLSGFGAWDDTELADHEANRARLLWVIAGYIREEPDYPIYLEA